MIKREREREREGGGGGREGGVPSPNSNDCYWPPLFKTMLKKKKKGFRFSYVIFVLQDDKVTPCNV